VKLLAFLLLLVVAQVLPFTDAQSPGEVAPTARENVARPAVRGVGDAPVRLRQRGNSKRAARRRYPPAPDVIIIGLEGKNILLGEKRGKVVIVDFWASWCPPCRRMIPIFNLLEEKYRNRGLEVIGISMDEGTTADLKGLAEEFGVRYTAADGDRETEEAFSVEVLPTTLLIDRKGNIRARHRGAISQAKLELEIKKLLSE
jgi:thiol-disulfide isomerase/thioredoxin